MTKKLFPLFIVTLLMDGGRHETLAANDIDCVEAFNTCMRQESCYHGYNAGLSTWGSAQAKCDQKWTETKNRRTACLAGCNFWWGRNIVCLKGQMCPN